MLQDASVSILGWPGNMSEQVGKGRRQVVQCALEWGGE